MCARARVCVCAKHKHKVDGEKGTELSRKRTLHSVHAPLAKCSPAMHSAAEAAGRVNGVTRILIWLISNGCSSASNAIASDTTGVLWVLRSSADIAN